MKDWKKITSWKNWILIGALLGVFLLFLSSLIFITMIYSDFFIMGTISSLFMFIPYLIGSVTFSHLFIFILFGILVAITLRIIKYKVKNKYKLILILLVLVLSLVIVFMDLKPQEIYSCSSNGLYPPNECLKEVAFENKDSDICYYLLDEFDRKDCLVGAFTAKAISNNNEKICYKLGDPYDGSIYYDVANCVTRVAKNNKDEVLCEGLDNDFGRVQEECYKEVAIAKLDLNLCQKTSSKYTDECYKGVLNKVKDPVSACKQLKVGGSLFSCYKNINCSLTEDEQKCNMEIKEYIDDPILCEAEEYEYDKNQCYYDYALRLNNPDFCAKMGGLSVSAPCFEELAIKNNNKSLCTVNGFGIYTCIKHFVDLANDPNLCLEYNDIYDIHRCAFEFVLQEKDISYCEIIPDEKWRADCIENFERLEAQGKL